MKKEIEELEAQSAAPDFWDDVEKAQKIIGKLNDAKSVYDRYESLNHRVEEASVFLDLLEEENALEELGEVAEQLKSTRAELDAYKIELLLNGEYDHNDAIVTIHAGAGGLEATDWAQMLFRMYTRWIDNHGYQYQVTDYNDEEGGGMKSATLLVKGRNAFGYLKSEKGVHRLVRISPYDSSKRRHTSFASVDVYPRLDDAVEIDIDPKDLKIDTYRSTGAGGQHVNTTDSAVRITHLPTGVIVQCQSERSQIQNRETAMNMLKAKLQAIAEEENREKIGDIQGQYSQIAWGSQIRSYVFQPYTLVKDHRTGEEVGNVQSVMDGGLDSFINAYLSEQFKKE